MSVQVNITISEDWRDRLEKIARKEAYERDCNFTYLDVIREAIDKHCGFTNKKLIEKYKNDVISFCEECLKINDPLLGSIPFKLYDYQKRYLIFLNENNHVIGTKFRQGGFTTLNMAWTLWKCIFYPNTHILIVSKTDREATTIGDNLQAFISHLPLEIMPRMLRATQHEKVFDNLSCIMSNTIEACRSKQFNVLILDEPSFIHNMEQHWRALYPIIATGGKCIATSTISYVDQWFKKTYMDAEAGKNSFKVFNCSYKEHPLYKDKKWIKETKQMLGEKGWNQEIECFF